MQAWGFGEFDTYQTLDLHRKTKTPTISRSVIVNYRGISRARRDVGKTGAGRKVVLKSTSLPPFWKRTTVRFVNARIGRCWKSVSTAARVHGREFRISNRRRRRRCQIRFSILTAHCTASAIEPRRTRADGRGLNVRGRSRGRTLLRSRSTATDAGSNDQSLPDCSKNNRKPICSPFPRPSPRHILYCNIIRNKVFMILLFFGCGEWINLHVV